MGYKGREEGGGGGGRGGGGRGEVWKDKVRGRRVEDEDGYEKGEKGGSERKEDEEAETVCIRYERRSEENDKGERKGKMEIRSGEIKKRVHYQKEKWIDSKS